MSRDNSRKPSRRAFIAQLGGASLAAAGSVGLGLWLHNRKDPLEPPEAQKIPGFSVESSPGAPRMSIVRGGDPGEMVRVVVDGLGGIGRFIGENDVVLIKPNVAFDRPPEIGATTHPEVLRALVALCLEAGAREVRVTDNPISNPEACFSRSGIGEAARSAGARVLYPVPGSFSPVSTGGTVLGTWPFLHGPFRGATKLIGVAPAKDHTAAVASMTLKNWYGFFGGRRDQFHQRIHEVIAELASFIRPTFVILDGIRVMMRNGPTGGSPSDLRQADTLVAGTDPVAVDSYGITELLGRRIEDHHYVAIAHTRGLGNRNWHELNPVEA